MVVRARVVTLAVAITTMGCVGRTLDDGVGSEGGDLGPAAPDDGTPGDGAPGGGPGGDGGDAPAGSSDGGGDEPATDSADDDEGAACDPGTVVECTCDEGLTGTSECDASGVGYLECQCPVPPGIPDANCDDVLICVDCRVCASSNDCSEYYEQCVANPGCASFSQCSEDCDASYSCFLDCMDGLDARTTLVALQWAECTVAACPESCDV
mgnify:CR=1 FL=1